MPSQRPAPNPLRLVLGSALLAGVALLAASCVDALDLDGRRDAYADTCDVVDRCYGDSYTGCYQRLDGVYDVNGLLEQAPACVEGCGSVYKCLAFDGVCRDLHGGCRIDADCCGFVGGFAACGADGSCCRPLGGDCTGDGDCCPGQGTCDDGKCGGVTCAASGVACLNDFQCCTGKCGAPGQDGKRACADLPCPPEGFACETNADCCNLVCRDGRCAAPADCALLTETCSSAHPCCDPALSCFTPPGADLGICTDDPMGCFPDSSDCFSDAQCCSKHCLTEFKLCGQCASNDGDPCSPAAPCCAPLVCDDSAGPGAGRCKAP